MGYPYWLAWTSGLKAVRPFQPRLPMFFGYGQRKPFMFHSVAWRDALAEQPANQVAGYRAGLPCRPAGLAAAHRRSMNTQRAVKRMAAFQGTQPP